MLAAAGCRHPDPATGRGGEREPLAVKRVSSDSCAEILFPQQKNAFKVLIGRSMQCSGFTTWKNTKYMTVGSSVFQLIPYIPSTQGLSQNNLPIKMAYCSKIKSTLTS